MKSKTLQRIAAVLTFFVFWAGVEACARYFTEPIGQAWPMVREDRIAVDGTIDTVFVGASLFRNGIIPAVMDQALGTRSYNYSTSSQSIELSGYALEDLSGTNPVKLALIDISANRLMTADEDGTYIAKYVLLSHMADWEAQWDLLKNCFTLDEFPLIVLHTARDQLQFFLNSLGARLKASYLRDYLKYGYGPDPMYTAGSMGYTPGNKANPSGGVPMPSSPQDGTLPGTNQLERVIDLCREKGITPILVSMPTTDAYMLALGQYDALLNPVRELARQEDILYLDFNLSKFRVSSLTAANFSDERHLNSSGAELFTPVLAEVLEKALMGEDTSGYFYGSYDEMIRDIRCVASVGCEVDQTDSGAILRASSLQSPFVRPYYRFLIRSADADGADYRLLDSEGAECPLENIGPGVYSVRVEACSAPGAPCDVYAEKTITVD